MMRSETEDKPWLWQITQGGVLEDYIVPDDATTRMGNVLRRALLLNPPDASLPGLAVSVTYAPVCIEQGPVGGDFFDAFTLPGDSNEVALLMGDMTGKGVEVAVHIAAVKFALRAFLRASCKNGLPCPGETLAQMNDFVCHAQMLDGWEPSALVSVALVIINTVTGLGRFALAAAEAPLILPDGQKLDNENVYHGVPLGAFADQQYKVSSLQLPIGAILLLLTDGLAEARSPTRTPTGKLVFLGCEGVARLTEKEPDMKEKNLSKLGRELLEQTRTYAGGRLSDDACLLLARRHQYEVKETA